MKYKSNPQIMKKYWVLLLSLTLVLRSIYMLVLKKVMGISNLISTNLRNLQCNALVNMYKCYVRPTLEYNSVIFSPHNIHFTKHLPGLYNFDYVERLKICKLESLELRRIKCDVIMLFKILHSMIHVDLCNNSIAVSNVMTRDNSYKLVKHRVR